MKKIYLLSFFVLFVTFSINAQRPKWISHFTGTGDSQSNFSTSDENDNIYVLGTFNGTVTQAANQGITKSITTKGVNDAFVAKYSSDGDLLWLRQIGGAGAELTGGLAYDPINKRLWAVVRTASSTLSDENLDLLFTKTGTSTDMMLCSLDPNTGDIIAKENIGLSDHVNSANDIRTDSIGNVVMVGTFTTKIKFTSIDSLTADAGYTNLFLAKFDKNGKFVRSKLVDAPYIGATQSFIRGINAVKDNYFISGYYKTKLKIDNDSIKKTGTDYDVFIIKTDTLFNIAPNCWIRTVRGPADDICFSVTVNNEKGCYVSGNFSSTYLVIDSTETDTTLRGTALKSINKGGEDFFCAKYDSAGILKWFNVGGTTGNDRIYRIRENANSVIMSGYYSGKLVFKNDSITSEGLQDALSIVLDKYNNLVYLIGWGGSSGNDLNYTGLIDKLGNFTTIGNFASSKVYFKLAGVKLDSLSNAGGPNDIAIVKYSKASITMSISQPVCPGINDGSVAAIPKGTTQTPYTYKWTKKGDATFNSTEPFIYNIGPGTYYCEFKDFLGFTITDSAILNTPAVSSVSVAVASNTPVSCFNGSDGKIDITPSGGYGAYTYGWTALSGSGLIPTQQDQNTLAKGTYKVNVTDSKGCKVTSNNISVSEPLQINLVLAVTDASSVGGSDGSIDLTVNNGAGPFGYAWTKVNDGLFSKTTEDIGSLNVGIYNIEVTDSKGCKANNSGTVNDPNLLVVGLTASHITCKDSANGSITATITNGNGSYTYTWTKQGDAGFTAPNAATINDLAPGTYVLNVTDGSKSGSNQIVITEPLEFKIQTQTITNIFCYGTASGSIDVALQGGTLPYSYSWTKSDEPGYIASSANLVDVIGGTYHYLATDNKGCKVNAEMEITQVDSMVVDAQIQPMSCFGESYDGYINQSITGGNGGYTFLWSNNLQSEDILDQKPGAFYCTIKDSKNCTLTKRYIIDEPGLLYASFVVKDITCYGLTDGNVEIKMNGGSSPYTYVWADPIPITETGAKVLNLGKGTYSVKVKDSKKCEGEFTMPTPINEPDSLSIVVDSVVKEIVGNDGKVVIHAAGGVTPYNYLLMPLGTNNANGSFLNLPPNKYVVYLTDKNNCGPINSDTLIVDPKPVSLLNSSLYSANVYPNPNAGIFSVLVYGTASQFQMSISDITGKAVYTKTFESSEYLNEFPMNISHLSKGIYLLKVNDSSPIKIIIQ